jgi:16S rRNA C967 or C1407 C5-methylase (RsmB/RsmF family)/NOL1/NOP2/fmu family ribosome biogenesis protein
MLPVALLNSLEGVKGFNRKAFEEVHASGEQITSIRINQDKNKTIDGQWSMVNGQSLKYSPFAIHSNIPWCPHGFYLTERPSFTFDPLFHAGAYYVQEASSMFLWHMLQQTVGNNTQKKVLDVCAAPGGKSTLLSSYFTDGLVVSNEVIKSRAAILTENIIKWGNDNIVVTNNDPKDFTALKNYFDVMVIDAPCSGSGLFRKDADAINEWSEENVNHCSLRQQRIIADVLPCLKNGGILIYSTCSYSKQEDEDVLDWMMNEFQVASCRLQVNEDWNIIETESSKDNAFGYRFYPDKIKGEGFFIAAFQKIEDDENEYFNHSSLTMASKKETEFIQSFYSIPDNYLLFKQQEYFRLLNKKWKEDVEILAKHLYIKKAGVELGEIKGKDFIPSHELAVSCLPKQNLTCIELDKEQALQYLRRKDIAVAGNKGWNMVSFCGLPLGWIKVLPNRINNYYPSSWRILKD